MNVQVHIGADVDFTAVRVRGRYSSDEFHEAARARVALRSGDGALRVDALRHEADDVESFQVSDVGFSQNPIHVQTSLRAFSRCKK